MLKLPNGAPLGEILMQSDAVAWREKSLRGVAEKMLWRDEASGASIVLIKFAADGTLDDICGSTSTAATWSTSTSSTKCAGNISRPLRRPRP